MKESVVPGENGCLSSRSEAWSRAGKDAKEILIGPMNASGDPSTRLAIRVDKKLAQLVRGGISPIAHDGGQTAKSVLRGLPRTQGPYISKVARILPISRQGAGILEICAGTGREHRHKKAGSDFQRGP